MSEEKFLGTDSHTGRVVKEVDGEFRLYERLGGELDPDESHGERAFRNPREVQHIEMGDVGHEFPKVSLSGQYNSLEEALGTYARHVRSRMLARLTRRGYLCWVSDYGEVRQAVSSMYGKIYDLYKEEHWQIMPFYRERILAEVYLALAEEVAKL